MTIRRLLSGAFLLLPLCFSTALYAQDPVRPDTMRAAEAERDSLIRVDSIRTANAVRDSQRTKTRDETRATLSVVWGCVGFERRLDDAERWYRELLESAGASTARVSPVTSAGQDR